MKMKNEKGSGKKYDGFAIASFVIGLFILLNFIMSIVASIIFIKLENFVLFEILIFLFSTGLIIPTSLAGIILGIISIVRIKKNKKLRGMGMAITGTVIVFLIFLLYLAGSLIIGGL